MRIFTYKDLINVPLNKIYDKYAADYVSLLRFRSRVYQGTMTMEDALNKRLNNRALSSTPFNIYMDILYNKLCSLTKSHVSKPHFIVKLSQGYAPEIAIINKHPGRGTVKPKTTTCVQDILKELKKQEVKEIKEAAKKKVRPLNLKEKAYIQNVNVLNNAFNKVKNKGASL